MYTETYDTPGSTINIGLAWCALAGQKDVDKMNKVYAMHVEAPLQEVSLVKRFLKALSRGKMWPLGMKFRLVSEYYVNMKESNKEKHRYMVNKHIVYTNQISRYSCTQILNLAIKSKISTQLFAKLL